MTPSSSSKTASTHQKQPAAKVAFCCPRAAGARRGEPLRCYVQEPQLTSQGGIDRRAVGRRVLLRVDERHALVAARAQSLDLVLHQGDERRDDYREVIRDEGGQLVAERLPEARGHDDESVAPGQRSFARLTLAWPERLEAE